MENPTSDKRSQFMRNLANVRKEILSSKNKHFIIPVKTLICPKKAQRHGHCKKP